MSELEDYNRQLDRALTTVRNVIYPTQEQVDNMIANAPPGEYEDWFPAEAEK